MKSVFYSLLTLCLVCSLAGCSPADSGDKPGDETETPDVPPLTPPDDPDKDPSNPGDPGDPDPGDPNPGEPGPGEPGTPDNPDNPGTPVTPDPDLPENPIVEFFSRNFVTLPTPDDYQMINANGLQVVQPAVVGIPFYEGYENTARGNWYSYSLKGGKYALASYACDTNEGTSADNWLITEGIKVDYDRVLLYWKLCSTNEGLPQSYEVYLSTSPSLSDFKASQPIHQANNIYIDHLGNDYINNVKYMIDGYKGKTIYLAFRHTTSGKYKIGVTLAKLSASSFQLDMRDLEVTSMRCWWDSKPTNVTGMAYPIGAELTAELTIKNAGYDFEEMPLTVSYEYDGKTVAETTEPVSLKQGATYKYQFKKTFTYTDSSGSLLVKVAPLPGETRLYANSRSLSGFTTVKRPVMIRVLYEEASGQNCSVCSMLFREFDKLDAAYPDRTVGAMHIVDRATQCPYPAATGTAYRSYVMSKSRGWAAPPYAAANRNTLYKAPNPDIQPGLTATGARTPNLETPLITDFTSQCYTPLEITATHRFSDDRKKMFVDVEVEALQDLEGLNYGIGGLVLEDNVQHKNYSMLNLGKPVFNHLVRGVLGEMKKGVTGVIPASMSDGQKVTYTFEYDIPDMYDVLAPVPDQMYAAVMIIRDDESILTCNKTTKKAAAAQSGR